MYIFVTTVLHKKDFY